MSSFQHIISGVVLALFVFSSTAVACKCAIPTPNYAFEQADIVVSGTVERFEKDETWYEEPLPNGQRKYVTKTNMLTAWVTVTHTWKGIEPRSHQIKINTSLDDAFCGYPFKTGEAYLIYATRASHEEYQTGLCSGTKPLNTAQNDLVGLDKAMQHTTPVVVMPSRLLGPLWNMVFERQGGIGGVSQRLTVNSSGHANFEDQRTHEGHEILLASQELKELEQCLAEDELFSEVKGIGGCLDCFTYTVTLQVGDHRSEEGKVIRFDDTQFTPALHRLVEKLSQVMGDPRLGSRTSMSPQLNAELYDAVTDQRHYRAGQRVMVTVYNRSESPLWMIDTCGAPNVLVEVKTDEDGVEHGAYPLKDCSGPPREVAAHGATSYVVDVDSTYGYAGFAIKPGRYKFVFHYVTKQPDPTVVGAGVRITLTLYSNEFVQD